MTISQSKYGNFLSNKNHERHFRLVRRLSNLKRDVNAEKDFKTTANKPAKITCWREGRRIVELGFLSDQLEKGCSDCGKYLRLSCTESEIRQGFGSILWIICECGVLNKIQTGKTHEVKKGHHIFDVNTKSALGMLDSGLGATGVIRLTSVMNCLSF
jgi:hypothetical protein